MVSKSRQSQIGETDSYIASFVTHSFSFPISLQRVARKANDTCRRSCSFHISPSQSSWNHNQFSSTTSQPKTCPKEHLSQSQGRHHSPAKSQKHLEKIHTVGGNDSASQKLSYSNYCQDPLIRRHFSNMLDVGVFFFLYN